MDGVTPSVLMSGNFSVASSAEISSSGSPNVLAQPGLTAQFLHPRLSDEASLMPPHSTQPGSSSDSEARPR